MAHGPDNPEPPKPIKRWVVVDEEGAPRGFYGSDIWPKEKIPRGAIEITDQQYRQLLDNQPRSRWRNGKVTILPRQAPPPPPPNPLDEIKTMLADLTKRVGKLEQR